MVGKKERIVRWLFEPRSAFSSYRIHKYIRSHTMIRKLWNRMNNCYIVNLHWFFFSAVAPLLSLLALLALYNIIFIIVHKFLLLLLLLYVKESKAYRLFVGVFFLVRGLVREQKDKRMRSYSREIANFLARGRKNWNVYTKYYWTCRHWCFIFGFYYFHFSVELVYRNTEEISRCWKWIISIYLMTFGLFFFFFFFFRL